MKIYYQEYFHQIDNNIKESHHESIEVRHQPH